VRTSRKFEVGGNLANTPGSVIYGNELNPVESSNTPVNGRGGEDAAPDRAALHQTSTTCCLRQGNSVRRICVTQGHQCPDFLAAPCPRIVHLTWKYYLSMLGPAEAIDVVRENRGIDQNPWRFGFLRSAGRS